MKVRSAFDTDDDSQPVMVPRSDKALVAVSPERVRRLREHLIKTLRELRVAKHLEHVASPMRPEPTASRPAWRAPPAPCARGGAVGNGDDDAFLDDRTLARVRLVRPDMTEAAMLRLYLERVPPVGHRESCIFHGKQGCTLDRSMRADVCNSYYCGGLGAFVKAGGEPMPTKVFAGRRARSRGPRQFCCRRPDIMSVALRPVRRTMGFVALCPSYVLLRAA